MKPIVIDRGGNEHTLEAIEGRRAMEVIRDWGLDIKADCGGAFACATCHHVAEEWMEMLDAARQEEENMLDTVADIEASSRLSCQILVSGELDGPKLTLAPGSRGEEEA